MSTIDQSTTPPTCLWVSGVSLILFAAALAGAALVPAGTLTALVVLAIVLFALGWGRLMHAPAPATSGIVIGLMACLGVGVVAVTHDAAWGIFVAAFTVCAAFISEMMRGTRRTSMLGSLATTVSGSVIALTGMSWVALEGSRQWLVLAHPMGLCLVVAGACLFVRGSVWMRAGISVVACTLGGLAAVGFVMVSGLGGRHSVLAVSASVGAGEPLLAMLVVFGGFGLLAGLVVAGCHAFFTGRMAPTSTLGAIALGLVPWLCAAVPVYCFARLMGG